MGYRGEVGLAPISRLHNQAGTIHVICVKLMRNSFAMVVAFVDKFNILNYIAAFGHSIINHNKVLKVCTRSHSWLNSNITQKPLHLTLCHRPCWRSSRQSSKPPTWTKWNVHVWFWHPYSETMATPMIISISKHYKPQGQSKGPKSLVGSLQKQWQHFLSRDREITY